MKYQFQFAGANVSRRSSQPRKRLRIVLLALAFALAVLAYWQYLQHLTSGSRSVASNVESPAAAKATIAATATASATKATATAEAASKPTATAKPASPVAKTTTATTATTTTVAATKASVDTVAPNADLTQSKATVATASPAIPAKPTTSTSVATVTSISSSPATTVQATPESVPVRISSEPPPPLHHPRVRTPEDRLMKAGTMAMNNMLDLAKKYPDAYGFRAQDAFKDATLGKPLPIYNIDEADRAKYQGGQPIKPLLKPSDTWMFPVKVDDHVCCMVQVTYTGRDYVPGGASKLLGTAWNKIMQKWPESKGYHPCIVVNPEIPGYYFTIPELPTPNMTDIIKLSYFHPSLSPADVILASWR